MPMDEAVLDFQPLGVVNTPLGLRSRVVVVAVRREMVERAAAALEGAGLELEGIDLSAFGMVRALASEHEGAVLYINVAGLVNVAVANAAGCLFTRASAGGVEAIASALAERRGLTLEHARAWMTARRPRRAAGRHRGRRGPDRRHPHGARGRRARARRQHPHVAELLPHPGRLRDRRAGRRHRRRGRDPRLRRASRARRCACRSRRASSTPADDVDAGRLTVAAGLAVAERP